MNITILYIEDNPQNARLFQKMLYDQSYVVIIASTANAGLEMLKKHKIDLVFLDINLPDIDGKTLIQQIKADPCYADIPAVALTANAMAGDRDMYLDAGFDAYIAKPIIRIELLNTIRFKLQVVTSK